ncbi:hypothetical protein ONZ45_g4216 [Pleurotus djamor]|nr:hypothetical protein ONZ45_g4216 [Pleurotus djamor]
MLDLTTTSGVEQYLSTTPFKSTKVTPLSGGTANYIYRIDLETPFQGHSSLIFKHGLPFVGTIPFSLDRQKYEVEAMKFVKSWLEPGSIVNVPSVLHFDKEAAVIIMEDAGTHAKTLKQLLLDGAVSPSEGQKIGELLGAFIAKVHDSSKGCQDVLQVFDANLQGKAISAWATYGRLVETLNGSANLPSLPDPLLDISNGHLETISDLVQEVTSKMTTTNSTLVMGDFWPGNVVVNLTESGDLLSLYVVDWELAKTGLPGLDLGQFCAEIHTLRSFNTASESSCSEVLTAFLQSYASSTQSTDPIDLARSTATHIGAHLVAWTPRVDWGGKELTRSVVLQGTELLVRGHAGSHDFLKDSLVAPLVMQLDPPRS